MDNNSGWIHQYLPGTSPLTLLLLHGTGGDETSLLDIGRTVAPTAGLLAVRGRSLDEGSPRFFKRYSATSYDQDSLRQEADALAEFTKSSAETYGFDLNKLHALGYSNGANIALASLALNPDAYAGAILLRPVIPFDELPATNLAGKSILTIGGKHDPFLPYSDGLVPYLREAGATVSALELEAGHGLDSRDLAETGAWLQQR
jgi:phospholipase/carboxylesterase